MHQFARRAIFSRYEQFVEKIVNTIDSHFKHGTFIYRSSNIAIFGSASSNDTIITEEKVKQYMHSNLAGDEGREK